jgi:hypothetical protein
MVRVDDALHHDQSHDGQAARLMGATIADAQAIAA